MVEAREAANAVIEVDEEMKDEEAKANESSAAHMKVRGEPVEILVIDQEKWYVWNASAVNNQSIRDVSKTIFVKSMNNFIKTLLI